MTTTSTLTPGPELDLEPIEDADAPVEPWVPIVWTAAAVALFLFGC